VIKIQCEIHPEIKLISNWADQTEVPCWVCSKCIEEHDNRMMDKNDVGFHVNCRDCGLPMKQVSKLLETTLFCNPCRLKSKSCF